MDKLNKVIISMMVISVILFSIVVALLVGQRSNEKTGEEIKTQIGEIIYDECTDEYEEREQEVITTNTDEEKISPNCKIILTKHYKGCGDTINDYLTVPSEYVNFNKSEFQEKYKDWEIKDFSRNQVKLYREFEGECGEHYVLKDRDGKIIIYKVNEKGKQEEYEKTEISTDYLPKSDKSAINEGLKVNGKEKLNELIESFE